MFHKLVTTSVYRMPPTANIRLQDGRYSTTLINWFWPLRNYTAQVASRAMMASKQVQPAAGYCLVGAGTTHDDRLLIGVILGAELKCEGHPLGIDVLMRFAGSRSRKAGCCSAGTRCGQSRPGLFRLSADLWRPGRQRPAIQHIRRAILLIAKKQLLIIQMQNLNLYRQQWKMKMCRQSTWSLLRTVPDLVYHR